jgi:tetratricopeptide (TPR) repeat protein
MDRGEAPASAVRFVGRAHELGQIDLLARAAAAGRGSVVVVLGEAGIGKTHFCEEVVARAERAGLRAVMARCWTDGGAPPLWPWQPVLRQLCGDDAADLLASDSGLDAVDPDRFARFAAVTDRIAAACAERPACLVVDDVHAADAGTLLLTRFLARSLHRLGLILVLSRRPGEPAADSPEGRLLDELEATPIVIGPFDIDETAAFLAAHGLEGLDDDLRHAVFRVTGGHPFFLRHVAALGPPKRGQALPDGLQIAIDGALARLTPASRDVLRRAAVLGPAPRVGEAAGVAEVMPAGVLAAAQEAASLGLVTVEGPQRFAFTHELVRAAFEDGLTVAERLDAHARAAAVVVGDGMAHQSVRARRAYHARTAAPRSPDDARAAVAACREAARAMVRNFAYEQADSLLTAAVRLYAPPNGIGRAPGDFLLEWAQAALRCGRMKHARQRFEYAAKTAQSEGDPVVLAEAALGLGGHWVNEHRAPIERARVLALQRDALAGLPEDEVALRCRLRARLAAEAVFDGGPIEPVHEAIDAARRCDDPIALAETLSLSHHALFSTDHVRRRLGLADELVRVASEAGDGVLGLMGLCWRAVDLFHLGDDRALRALEELRERATALANQNIIWVVDVIDVMLLIREGRLAEAEEAAGRCYELGNAVGEVDTLGYLTAHLVGIRWLQDREIEILDQAEEVAASPTLIQAEFSLRASAAVILARAGRRRSARAALDRLTRDGLGALPQSSTWLVGMACIAEAAAILGDAGVAREAYDQLLPYADLPVVASLAVVCVGSTERWLGIAALAFGDPDRAVGHLERAVAANRRLGNWPLVAVAGYDLFTALCRRDGPDDRDRAVETLRRAVADAEAVEMSARAAAWRGELAQLQDGSNESDESDEPDESDRSDAGSGAAGASVRQGVLYQDGSRWVVGVDDRRVRIPDLLGLRYLAVLLARPGRPVPALALAGHGTALSDPSRQEVLDERARETYAARARDLADELAQAEAHNDIGRAERLRAELDALVDQLEEAAGFGTRSRAFADPAERARTSVRKAIKRAIDTISDADMSIGRMLRSSIETGHRCCYTPDPDTPITWSTAAPSLTSRG